MSNDLERFYGLNTEFFGAQDRVRTDDFQQFSLHRRVGALSAFHGVVTGPKDVPHEFEPHRLSFGPLGFLETHLVVENAGSFAREFSIIDQAFEAQRRELCQIVVYNRNRSFPICARGLILVSANLFFPFKRLQSERYEGFGQADRIEEFIDLLLQSL